MNELETAAEQADLTGKIHSLIAWLGEGRKLTQTGRIGLADARHLVELLGTGDTIDPEIGGRVFKTKSSEELAHLNRCAVGDDGIAAQATASSMLAASSTLTSFL